MIIDTELSRIFVQVVPRAMGKFRSEIREIAKPELTVLQFRSLAFLSHHETANNVDLAEHIGVLPSAMSRVVETLVERGYVRRRSNPADRRHVRLDLTARGKERFENLKGQAIDRFSLRFRDLSKKQKSDLARGLAVLEEVLARA